jgi:hypothetical protein
MPAFSVPVNLAFDSYTDLVTAVQDWLDRSDLSGSVQAMIALAEARMRRELNPLLMETSVTAVASNGVAALPSDCDVIRFISYNGGELRVVSPQHGRQMPEGEEPRAATIEANGIYLWPANDVAVTVTYQPKLSSLSESNPTNWLLSEHPDLYFFGTMLFAEGYLANDERAGLFKGLWDEALAEVKAFLGRQRRVLVRIPNPAVIA